MGPLAVQQMVPAVWLIAKGFRPVPVASAVPHQAHAQGAAVPALAVTRPTV